ncbi:hypothetical protein AVDCRST_MAG94-4010, partial [uncultured Leptolyngbya sp.]
MHAVVGAGLADDLLGFTEILTKPVPTAICHNSHLIWCEEVNWFGDKSPLPLVNKFHS